MIIKNGLVVLPGKKGPEQLDLKIERGRISGIGTFTDEYDLIDARGCLVLPGAIDAHVHFNEPGYTQREDFFHGSCAAAAGGVTLVIDMPCTSDPPVTDRAALDYKLSRIGPQAVVDFGLFGGVSGQSYQQGYDECMTELAEHVLGFKTYFISGMETFSHLNLGQFEQVLHKARELSVPVLLHAEDFWYVKAATSVAQTQGKAPRDWYNSRPEISETLAVAHAVMLSNACDAPLHIVHVGTAEAAELVQGPRVTCETAPHYLCFDLNDFEQLGAPLKVAPSLKTAGNSERLWQLLKKGTIDFVASDHAPCPPEAKQTGSIWTDYAGIAGTETMLPYLFSEGYLAGKIDLEQLVRISSTNAARRYGLDNRKGAIALGFDADLVLIDPKRDWTVDAHSFQSKGRVSPFQGKIFRGVITQTILRGTVIYDHDRGIMVQPGQGRYIRRIATE
ncbi:dihydroorotase family protein [bacterium]|nr:dihydroorotase family protein [bacterium]